MNTVGILLSAFILSFVALLVFIWSQRKGLFDRSSRGAEIIFAPDEIGRIEEPAATRAARSSLQRSTDAAQGGSTGHIDSEEIRDRTRADASTGPLMFFFFCCAVVWLLVASAAGLTASIKLHEPDWLTSKPG